MSPPDLFKLNVRLANRYCCALSLSSFCTRGNGKPTRQKCGYCGGQLLVAHGLWGVFVWTGTGRYPESDAVSTHTSEKLAQKRCDSPEGRIAGWVVRWIDY